MEFEMKEIYFWRCGLEVCAPRDALIDARLVWDSLGLALADVNFGLENEISWATPKVLSLRLLLLSTSYRAISLTLTVRIWWLTHLHDCQALLYLPVPDPEHWSQVAFVRKPAIMAANKQGKMVSLLPLKEDLC